MAKCKYGMYLEVVETFESVDRKLFRFSRRFQLEMVDKKSSGSKVIGSSPKVCEKSLDTFSDLFSQNFTKDGSC